jgi:hypothetical protein
MKYHRLILLSVIVTSVCANAQQVWDKMDVLDGPNPSLRYGFYTEPSGRVTMGRYYFINDGDNLRISLVAFGKTAVKLPVQKFDRNSGALEFGWEGRPDRKCRLDRHDDELFLGNCIEHLTVMPSPSRIIELVGLYR